MTHDLISIESPSEIIGGRYHLSNLQRWLKNVTAYWEKSESQTQPLGNAGIKFVEGIFCRPFEVRPLVSAILQEEERIRIKLTNQQAYVLRLLGRRKRIAICGGAGTGKTLLAVEKARQLADENLHTLLLCYNRPLAEHLKHVIGEHKNLTVMSFHELCGRQIQQVHQQYGRDLENEMRQIYPDQDHFAVQLPNALALSTEIVPERFDAIIIDEGQDFGEEFWLPVEELLRDYDESVLFIFYDQNQAIYQQVNTFPIASPPFPGLLSSKIFA